MTPDVAGNAGVTLSPDPESAPLQRVMVALDLEMTGLDPATDEIIEVGALRFRGAQVLDTFTTLVNPHRALSPFIQQLTKISQAEVDGAPAFGAVAPQLLAFMGDAPVVGHNVSFDLSFLAQQGLRFSNSVFDTWELASILLPRTQRSLAVLAATHQVDHPNAHRALNDARVTHQVLLALLERGVELGPDVLGELARLAAAARWGLRHLFQELEAEATARGEAALALVGPGGVDMDELRARLQPPRRRETPAHGTRRLEEERLVSYLATEGPLASVLPAYEARAEQQAMLRAVTHTLQDGGHLLVEAGTGVGKSMAYLLPAALFALRNNTRVVVSTNTLNLQEQLVHKDLPTVQATLEVAGEVRPGELRVTTLKGRANYLCLLRWEHLRTAETLTIDEARMLGKLVVWLRETATGDRAELPMVRSEESVWERLSAQGSQQCPYPGRGPCCLGAARERAGGAHIVVVNHALLVTDLQQGGGLLPDHDHLVIDEAHHLEAEATRQFGFRVTQARVMEALELLTGPRGLAQSAVDAYRGGGSSEARRQATADASQTVTEAAAEVRSRLQELFEGVGRFLASHGDRGDGARGQLLVRAATRAQPYWSNLEIAGENAVSALGELGRRLEQLHTSLDRLDNLKLVSYEELRDELVSQIEGVKETRGRLEEFFLRAQEGVIYWATEMESPEPMLCAAPLRVGDLLKEKLFDRKRSVVLTSATLSTAGSFDSARERLGMDEGGELLLGSPFDYKQAALVCLPRDMPEPNVPGYDQALAQTVAGLASAVGGRTMVLFTSHASLRTARGLAVRLLEGQDVRVLAQGVDGSPRHLLEEFLKDPRALLLGTASFWEGVDLAGEALQVLAMARLPFDVPTDPLFAARSELYEQPFMEYAVPNAILRFRQGFGRLIRTQQDRGAVVVLDRRITSRRYGELFLQSLPPCTVVRPTLAELPGHVTHWLAAGPPAASQSGI